MPIVTSRERQSVSRLDSGSAILSDNRLSRFRQPSAVGSIPSLARWLVGHIDTETYRGGFHERLDIRDVNRSRAPDDAQIYDEVVVNKLVPDSRYFAPGNLGMRGNKLRGETRPAASPRTSSSRMPASWTTQSRSKAARSVLATNS